ncbi:MAG: hypothetical protein QW521_02095 [Desulfurococcaceae archaeon]
MYVEQQKLEGKTDLALQLKLYGFDIGIAELEQLLSKTSGFAISPVSTNAIEKLQVHKCERIIVNSRGTLKLVIWSNGTYSLINKEANVEDFSRWSTPWGHKSKVIWEQLQEGSYVLFTDHSWFAGKRVSALLNVKDEKEAAELLTIYKRCLDKLAKYSGFREITNVAYKNYDGTVSLEDMRKWEEEIDKTIKKIEELEREERKKKLEAFATRLKREGQKTTINALDDHVYVIEGPTLEDEEVEKLIYRHRYEWTPTEQAEVKKNTLFYLVLDICMKKGEFKLGMDNKTPVSVQVKTIRTRDGKETRLVYLDGKRISYDDLFAALDNYFLKGEPLTIPEDNGQTQVRKVREEELITKGISGYIHDLEGETPVNMAFEKEGNNWYLIVGEKKMLLKGGTSTIKSLEAILSGKAHHRMDRHSTEEFYRRLCKVFTEEEALEIITTIKQLGKLVKAIGGNQPY